MYNILVDEHIKKAPFTLSTPHMYDLMAVDATKRPLKIDPRFIPYLEKHRIYELFYDITTNLAIRKPKDHILFIRNFLKEVNETRDKPRIIVFTPPHISGLDLAQLISNETGAKIVSLENLFDESEEEILPVTLALRLDRLVKKEEMVKTGWILHDFPRDYSEAKILQKHGIFPTHTFEICSSPEIYSLNDAWFANVRKWPLEKFKEALAIHKRKMFGVKKAYESTYRRVPVNARTLLELAKECVEITKIPVYKGAPMIPRVVLIGTRGSRRRTVARGLKQKFSMVHIDMDELIIQGLESGTEIGEELRRLQRCQTRIYARTILTLLQVSYFISNEVLFALRMRVKPMLLTGQDYYILIGSIQDLLLYGTVCPYPKPRLVSFSMVLLKSLSVTSHKCHWFKKAENKTIGKIKRYFEEWKSLATKRLLQNDCLKNGWVLTGIPRDLEDLRTLDTFVTPPNKVIFLSVEASKAFTRLINRRVNAYTGEMKSVQEIRNDPTDNIKEYIIHPRDNEINVKREQEAFDQHVQSMLNYCDENCYVVNGDGTNDEVIERVSKIVMEPGLIAPPRRPFMKPKEEKSSIQNTNFIISSRSCSDIYPRILRKITSTIEKGLRKNI